MRALALGAVLFVLTRGADIGTFELGLIYFITALPFIGTGIIRFLWRFPKQLSGVDKVLFFSICWGLRPDVLALVALLNAFGGPNTVIAVSIIFPPPRPQSGFSPGRLAAYWPHFGRRSRAWCLRLLLIVNFGHPFIGSTLREKA